MFVARPLAACAGHAAGRGSNLRESTLVGWAGLRGAVPIVLATFPVIEGVAEGRRVLQHRLLRGPHLDADPGGDASSPLATPLGVTSDEPAVPRPLHEVGTIRRLGAEVLEFPVREADAIVGLAW